MFEDLLRHRRRRRFESNPNGPMSDFQRQFDALREEQERATGATEAYRGLDPSKRVEATWRSHGVERV